MKLSDVFDYLRFGELSHLALGNPSVDATPVEINPKDYPKLAAHVNLALTALYSRFWLSSQDVIIQLYDHIQQYYLHTKYAETNNLSTEVYRYIKDSVFEPFQDNVLKIEQVFNEGGEGLFLNDLTEPWSIFTPTYNSIQIPYPMGCNHLLVHYRANHPKIVLTPDMDPSSVELQIPEGFLEPLLFYVAHRVFSSLNVDQNAEANNFLQKYEQSCQQMERQGLYVTPNYSNLKLDKAGWV